ncbi:MAG: M15 family metallopeptidase [Bacteroidota bacterium]
MKYSILIIAAILIATSSCKEKSHLSKNEQFIKDSTDLINVLEIIPNMVIDVKYATTENLSGVAIYPNSNCYLKKSTAEKLKKAQAEIEKMGARLKIFDAYRPMSIQKKMWEMIPDERMIANQSNGDKHSRGSSVDIALVSIDGKDIDMGSLYDARIPEAERLCPSIDEKARMFREILNQVMTNNGFIGSDEFWWHYDDIDWEKNKSLDYPL